MHIAHPYLSLSNQNISQATNLCILEYDKRAVGIDAFQACQITSSSVEKGAKCAIVGTMRAVTSLVVVTYASITVSKVKSHIVTI